MNRTVVLGTRSLSANRVGEVATVFEQEIRTRPTFIEVEEDDDAGFFQDILEDEWLVSKAVTARSLCRNSVSTPIHQCVLTGEVDDLGAVLETCDDLFRRERINILGCRDWPEDLLQQAHEAAEHLNVGLSTYQFDQYTRDHEVDETLFPLIRSYRMRVEAHSQGYDNARLRWMTRHSQMKIHPPCNAVDGIVVHPQDGAEALHCIRTILYGPPIQELLEKNICP